jgi:hypothetical protein
VSCYGRRITTTPELGLASARIWSSVPPRRLARWGLGHPSHPADLLGGDLIVCPTSQTCSAGFGHARLEQGLWALLRVPPFLGTRQRGSPSGIYPREERGWGRNVPSKPSWGSQRGKIFVVGIGMESYSPTRNFPLSSLLI